jgi:hypothetical protein
MVRIAPREGGGGGRIAQLGLTFYSSCQAKELEFENKQLRRTISSLAKATAAERDTYLALQVKYLEKLEEY